MRLRKIQIEVVVETTLTPLQIENKIVEFLADSVSDPVFVEDSHSEELK